MQSFEVYEPKPRIHVVEFVHLRGFGKTFAFMRLSMRLYKLARELPGYYAGGIRGKWWSGRFWSYSIWEDHEAMMRFVNSRQHTEAAARIGDFAGPGSCYAEWVSEDPPDWDEATNRLENPTRYFVPPGIGNPFNR